MIFPHLRSLCLAAPLGAAFALSLNPTPRPAHSELLADVRALTDELRTTSAPEQLLLERASIFVELGEYSRAMRDLTHADAAGADSHEVRRTRARVELMRGRADRALAEIECVLDADASDLTALRIRAEARVLRGEFVMASDDFGRAAGLVARRPLDLVVSRADTLANVDERRALHVLDDEIRKRGDLASLHLKALDLERQIGDADAALIRITRLRELGVDEARLRTLEGQIHRSAGDHERARMAFRRALVALDSRPTRRRTTRAALALRADIVAALGGKVR